MGIKWYNLFEMKISPIFCDDRVREARGARREILEKCLERIQESKSTESTETEGK